MHPVVFGLIPNQLDTASDDGTRPLHLAARWGRPAALRELLRLGASPHATTNAGETALHLAARYNQVDVIRPLLLSGKKAASWWFRSESKWLGIVP